MSPAHPNAVATADVAVTGNEAWAIVSRLIAGMFIYGALGWAVGSWMGHITFGMSVGVFVGAGLGLYLSVVRIRRLDAATPSLVYAGSTSWSARFTRVRMQRAGEATNDG